MPFFRKFKPKPKENQMLLPNVRKLVSALRERSRQIRGNNKKIDEWVDSFLNRSALNGEMVTLLTQWCISKDLEKRCKEQGRFFPTRAEQRLFAREIPEVAKLFTENGLAINWIITFNRSYLDSGRISPEIERAYKKMIGKLAETMTSEGWLIILDWEDDVLGIKSEPDKEVLSAIKGFVPEGALNLEIDRHSAWARDEAGLTQSDEELQRDVFYQIACEAGEGSLLLNNSPLGEFLLIPLEVPERYDFFTLKAPKFKERIVPVMKPYPWRV